MKKINFAIIGTNHITDSFLECAKAVPELVLAAVYSRSLERAKEFGAKYEVTRCYDKLTDLAADLGIDAVYIASPNCYHCSQSIQMMEAGKHVLCEKPIASNYPELKTMLTCAEKNKVVLLEAMRPIFDPGFRTIIDNIPKIGRVRRATFVYCQYSSRYDKFKAGIIENAFRPEFSNGALMDIGVYCVHPMVRIFGMPQKISAQAINLVNGIDGAGTIVALYDGMLSELIYSKISNTSLPSQIQGEEGSMIIGEIYDTTEIIIHNRQGKSEIIKIQKENNNMYYEAREWARLIETNGDCKGYHESSIMELKVMDEARRQTGNLFPADGTGIEKLF